MATRVREAMAPDGLEFGEKETPALFEARAF